MRSADHRFLNNHKVITISLGVFRLQITVAVGAPLLNLLSKLLGIVGTSMSPRRDIKAGGYSLNREAATTRSR